MHLIRILSFVQNVILTLQDVADFYSLLTGVSVSIDPFDEPGDSDATINQLQQFKCVLQLGKPYDGNRSFETFF